ncbi:hypothetical protein PUNSTDRAFT_145541 [Punctularia strigosozonata HHB-11173 SS5]|uniref:uncharacterized protein n=1 Tax=Punctularia strigosozonata (strain HHB-11173) TaxID=741275 RepID=UPI0004417BC0|nr:uncharacterized protein PUNSTDRAFT_145541 [Punctularia strigosozonata HHB-11173 SS5]EIN06246.1 hypothetical protein PUNSTDRAFT_145541 [Punctularia strigosozonata HHB-11173 SS5]
MSSLPQKDVILDVYVDQVEAIKKMTPWGFEGIYVKTERTAENCMNLFSQELPIYKDHLPVDSFKTLETARLQVSTARSSLLSNLKNARQAKGQPFWKKPILIITKPRDEVRVHHELTETFRELLMTASREARDQHRRAEVFAAVVHMERNHIVTEMHESRNRNETSQNFAEGKQPYHDVPEDNVMDYLKKGKTPSYNVAELTNEGMDSMLAILDKAEVRPAAPVEQDTSELRTPSDQFDSRGNRVLFYARAKLSAWASTDRLRLIQAYEPDELLQLKKEDIIAVTHESRDGWFRGQRFTLLGWRHLCKPDRLRDPQPPTSKLSKEPLPFVSHLKSWYKDRLGTTFPKGTTVSIGCYPSKDMEKDGTNAEKMIGSLLQPAESGLFPVHYAKKILGPRTTELPEGILYYMTVWHDFDGRNMHPHDAKTNLWFEPDDVIAVIDAPPDAPWKGEVVTRQGSHTRPSGSFMREAVEAEFLI